MRARVASAAARTSAAAEATASVIQHSVLQTFRAAGTGAEKAVVFASTAGVVAFFLPWFGGFGGSASGFAMAQQVSGLLWVLPLSFGTCFFLSYLNIKAAPRQRALRARWFLFLGSFWVAVVLLATVAGRSLFGIAAIGLYLTLVSTAAIAVGGFMQIGETLGDM